MISQNNDNMLQDTHKAFLDQERAKIDNNINVLYKLSNKAYPGLTKALQGTKQASITPKQLLLSILNYIKDKELIYDKSVNRYVFFLDTKTITYKLRKKTTQGVSTRAYTKEYSYKLLLYGALHKGRTREPGAEQQEVLDFINYKLEQQNNK